MSRQSLEGSAFPARVWEREVRREARASKTWVPKLELGNQRNILANFIDSKVFCESSRYALNPFLLVFGLHSLCTEPVNWVSGRYDLLATSFVLLAFYVLIGNANQFRWWKGILGAFFLLLGLLSKEVAAGSSLCTMT